MVNIDSEPGRTAVGMRLQPLIPASLARCHPSAIRRVSRGQSHVERKWKGFRFLERHSEPGGFLDSTRNRRFLHLYPISEAEALKQSRQDWPVSCRVKIAQRPPWSLVSLLC